MVLDAEQTTLIHEALQLFQGTTFDWYDYNDRVTGVITSVPIHNQIDLSEATDRLAVILAAIVASSDGREVRIKEILAEYDMVSLDSAVIKTGGGGGVVGARYNPRTHRSHLRRLLMANLGIRVTQRGLHQGNLNIDGSAGGSGFIVGR